MDQGLLRPGDLLNNTYRIEELVGEGGTGEVYRAINTASERTVAIKILKAQFSQDPKFIDLMRRELLHTIADDAVIRYYDLLRTADSEGGNYFLVMDFIPGPSVADLMRSGPLDTGTLMVLAERVTRGLAACHAARIFHRDISPDNIILRGGDPAGATLIDFGIAKDVTPDAKTVVGGGFAGKYEYAAPEQLDGLADARSDIYSFGMTLLAAAEGRAPQLGSSFLEIVKAKHAPVDTSALQEPLRSLVDAMTRPSPDERPQSAMDLLRMIGGGAAAPAYAADGPVPAPPGIENLLAPEQGAAPPRTRPPGQKRRREDREPKRRRSGGLLWGALALLLVGGGIAALLGPGRETLDKLLATFQAPEVSPYTLTASAEGASGYAPDEQAAASLAVVLAERLGIERDAVTIEVARGAPNENWQSTATALAGLVPRLEEGRLALSDAEATLEGTAPDPDALGEIERNATRAAENGGFQLAMNLDLAPQPLSGASVTEIVDAAANCGVISARSRSGADFEPGETIIVQGTLADEASRTALGERLAEIADGRRIDLDGVAYRNPSVCGILAMVEPLPEARAIFRFVSGSTEAEIEGAFARDDVPVVTLEIPSNESGYVYAFVVDNDNNVLHVFPAPPRQANEIEELGEIARGRRLIPLLWPEAEASQENVSITFSEPYGTMMVVALIADAKILPHEHTRAEVEPTEEWGPVLAQAIQKAEDDGTALRRAIRLIEVDTQ